MSTSLHASIVYIQHCIKIAVDGWVYIETLQEKWPQVRLTLIDSDKLTKLKFIGQIPHEHCIYGLPYNMPLKFKQVDKD